MTISTTTATDRACPFVGPRSFRLGEPLFGRDREIPKLLDLLIAERIVLLFSPSGAGKTSLIQAGLIPVLREEGFYDLPIIRVKQPAPPDQESDVRPPANRYLRGTLESLESRRPEAPDDPPVHIADLDALESALQRWADALQTKTDGRAPRLVLIFDQFEELLTTDPTDHDAKEVFFDQLGAVLKDPGLWALFAIREEYVAALEPYLNRIPRRLASHFRLDLLDVDAARQAFEKPFESQGVTVTPGAVNQLVTDLSRVRVQRPDGTSEVVPGPYVEPVHLQIVGLRLWNRFGGDSSFTRLDETKLAGTEDDADAALAGYYADTVRKLAEGSGIFERTIRDWCETQLITEQGLRGQVLREPGQTRGLPESVISDLVGAHLVRAEERRGSIWYELAHDRLIEPVHQSNRLWREQHLHPALLRATDRDPARKPDSLLLRGRELADVEAWAKDNDALLGELERDYLRICREARSQRRRLCGLLGIAMLVAAVMGSLFFWANYLKTNLDIQLRYKTIADAVSGYDGDPSKLLGIDRDIDELGHLSSSDESKARRLRDEKLAIYVSSLIGQVKSLDDDKLLTRIGGQLDLLEKYNPDLARSRREDLDQYIGRLKVVADRDRSQNVRSAVAQGLQRMDAKDLLGAMPWFVRGLRLEQSDPLKSRTHRERLTALLGASPRLEQTWLHQERVDPGSVNNPSTERVVRTEFSPDGRRVVTVGESVLGGKVRIWSIDGNGATSSPRELAAPARFASFSPDGRRVVTAGEDGHARVWDVETGEPSRWRLDHGGEVLRAVFDGKGRRILTVSQAGESACEARVWDAESGAPLTPTLPHPGLVSYAEFNPSGDRVLTAGLDRTVRVWDAAGAANQPIATLRHDSEVYHASFGPDDRIATACEDGTAWVWRTDPSDAKKYVQEYRTSHPGPVWQAVFGRDGTCLYTVSQTDLDNPELRVRVWNTKSKSNIPGSTLISPAESAFTHEIYAQVGLGLARLLTTGVSPDGRRLMSVTYREGRSGHAPGIMVRSWDIASGAPLSEPVSLDGPPVALTLPDSDARRYTSILTRAAFSGSGGRVAVAASDNLTKRPDLWLLDGATGKRIQLENESEGIGSHIEFSPDGRFLVNIAMTSDSVANAPLKVRVADAPLKVRVWETGQGRALSRWLTLDAPVRGHALSPDGTRLALFGGRPGDGRIRVWKLSPGEPPSPDPEQRLAGKEPITQAVFSNNGRQLATVSEMNPRTVTVWDVGKGYQHIPWIPMGRTKRKYLFFSESTLDSEKELTKREYLPTLDHGTELATDINRPAFEMHFHEVVVFSPDGQRLLTAAGTSARVWDTSNAAPVTPSLFQGTEIESAAFSADGRRVLLTDSDRSVRVWDATTGEPITPVVLAPFSGLRLSRALFREGDGAVVVVGNVNLMIINRRPPSHPGAGQGAPPDRPEVREWLHDLWHATFSRDGRRAVLRGNDHVRLWHIDRGEPIGPLLPQGGSPLHADFSPDGRRLVTAGDDGLARVWDLTVGDPEMSPLCWRPELAAGRSPHPAHPGSTGVHRQYGSGRQLEIFVVELAPDDRLTTLDLGELGELLSTSMLDDQGGVSPLGGPRLAALHRGLAKKHPWRFAPTNRELARWHERQAYEAELYGRWEAVEAHLDPLLAHRPDAWDLLARRARARAERGLFEPAREDLKRARSLAADPVREWLEHQADADWFAKNWPMASFELGTLIEVYGGRLAERPDAWNLLARRARARAERGLFEPAREDLKRARSLAADPVREWLEHQADADWFAKNWPMASFELGTLIEVYGGRIDLYRRRGEALSEMGKWKEAAADFGQGAALAGAPTDLALAHAAALLAAGDRDEYRKTCAALVARFGQTTDPALAERIARVCSLDPSSGVNRDALSDLASRAVTGEPKNRRFLATRGAVFSYAGDNETAVKTFDEAIKDEPKPSTFLLLSRAISLARLGRAREAQADYKKAGKVKGKDFKWEDRPSEIVLERQARELLKAIPKEIAP